MTGETLVLRSSRRKWLLVFVIAAVFVGLGLIIAIGQHDSFGWTAAVFFGLVLIVAAWQLISPGRLVVTPTAIEVTTLWRTYSRDLASCSEFGVWRIPRTGQRLVVFDHPLDTAKRMGRANKRFAGRSASLPDTFGMKAADLATLLNKARAAAKTSDG
jgi:hypothetical protein